MIMMIVKVYVYVLTVNLQAEFNKGGDMECTMLEKQVVIPNPYCKGDCLTADEEGYYIFHDPHYLKCTMFDVDRFGIVIYWHGRPKEAREICRMGKLVVERMRKNGKKGGPWISNR